jgi:hypothetical protein
MNRDFAIREFSRQSSDLYTLRVSEMPRSRHVSSLMDGPNDFVTSQVKISPVRSRGLNLVHFLTDPMAIGPLRKI